MMRKITNFHQRCFILTKNDLSVAEFAKIRGFGILLCAVSAFLLFATDNLGNDANIRTKAEVESLIENLGKTPPDWWDSVQLEYPDTLDFTWPKPKGKWNPRKNVGQYIWDIINPNPRRWKQGIKLLHHILTVNKDNPATLEKTMNALGRMYHDLLEDWERAAFWWRKCAEIGGPHNVLGLAHCYWKLGNKDTAVKILSRIGNDYTRYGAIIKLWADMGECDRAVKLAEAKARSGMTDSAYLAAGDACRFAGRYELALEYYRKVLDVPATGRREKDIQRNKKRARANIKAIKLFDSLDLTRIPDDTYESSSIAYAGRLHIEVKVKESRIESVRITKH